MTNRGVEPSFFREHVGVPGLGGELGVQPLDGDQLAEAARPLQLTEPHAGHAAVGDFGTDEVAPDALR